MRIIRVDVNHKENITIIKEQKTADVFMIKISFHREKYKFSGQFQCSPATRENWHVGIKWCFWAFSGTELSDS